MLETVASAPELRGGALRMSLDMGGGMAQEVKGVYIPRIHVQCQACLQVPITPGPGGRGQRSL